MGSLTHQFDKIHNSFEIYNSLLKELELMLTQKTMKKKPMYIAEFIPDLLKLDRDL
jgi:hypothetical protein